VARQNRPLVWIVIFEHGTAYRLPAALPQRIVAAAMPIPR
jgi:hypothetical protein